MAKWIFHKQNEQGTAASGAMGERWRREEEGEEGKGRRGVGGKSEGHWPLVPDESMVEEKVSIVPTWRRH